MAGTEATTASKSAVQSPEQLQDEASESDVLGSPLGRQPDASLDESCLDKSDDTTPDSLEKSPAVSHESYKAKLMDKLVVDEKAFEAASVEIARLRNKLFTAIAIGASKLVQTEVDVGDQVAGKGLKRVADDEIDERSLHAKKQKM